MEPKEVVLVLLKLGLTPTLLIVSMLCLGAEAQSSCTGTLVGLSQCLNYVTGNSSTPSSSCCTQLLTVVQSQPQCLCAILNGGAAILGVNINKTLATSLPDACYVKTPPAAQCNGSSGLVTPATPPTSPPTDSSDDDEPETPTTASQTSITSAGTGSKTLPSINGNASDGGTKRRPIKLIVIFLVSCVAIKM